jgi:AcrR family transcriptional regulator
MSATTLAPTQADATRARIADTAERLFRSMGYQKTAVADIARELGMSPANVYRFFASKSAINEAITLRLLEQVLAGLEAIAARPDSAEARLHAVAQHLHSSSMTLFFHEKRMHDMVASAMGEHWGVIAGYIERFIGLVARIIAEGMASGEFAQGDPARAAIVFKHATLAWHHPMMVEECMRIGTPVEAMGADMADTVALIVAGLKRGAR